MAGTAGRVPGDTRALLPQGLSICRSSARPAHLKEEIMPVCEYCWNEAYSRVQEDPWKSQTDHYLEIINDSDHQCKGTVPKPREDKKSFVYDM